MRRGARIVLTVAGSIAFIGVTAAGTIYGVSGSKLRHVYPLPERIALSTPIENADVLRGRHLVHNVSMCVDCHGADLGGKEFMDAGPIGMGVATNLTRGRGGIGSEFTDEDWILAIRHGLRRDGRSLLVMPSGSFAHYSDADLAAIIAYLKTVPPVDRELPRTELRMLGRALLAAGKLPFQVAELTPRLTDRVIPVVGPTAEYGAYLAKVGGCTGCHGPDLSGGPAHAPGTPAPSNITPAGNIGKWTEQEFYQALRTGTRPDGTKLSDVMPWRFMAGMADDELRALWLHLQTVPPKQSAAQ